LASIGYDAEWHCIPASAVGAPHRRDRIWIVAYPKSELQSEKRGLRLPKLAEWFSGCGQAHDVTNYIQERIQGSRQRSFPQFSEFSWCKNVRRIEDLRNRSDIPEPIFRGSRDGVPDWVDRIAGLGNAVVPQIPEMIGAAILEAED
jgi:DNA (cytosine-5)-methyltransferase 1